MKPLFQQRRSVVSRLVLVCLLALLLLVLDARLQMLAAVRSWLLAAAEPFYQLVDLPAWLADSGQRQLMSRDDLLLENARLEAENRVLQARLQKLNALTIENIRLRELLNSTRPLQESATVAEIIAVSPDPFSHHVVVNKGSSDGVSSGQAVIDANGLVGQVTDVSPSVSRVMLISDLRHAVPVRIDRNGVRLIVEGSGDFQRLQVPFVAQTTDITVGDILSTSGLGGVFPANYPVARVIAVDARPGAAFLVVEAEPFAHLARARHVLLLSGKSGDEQD
ncbi:MAG TPA: rod shape-determining protein MreC [Pseudomonadales bacterium]